jgi:hypothetical protein
MYGGKVFFFYGNQSCNHVRGVVNPSSGKGSIGLGGFYVARVY